MVISIHIRYNFYPISHNCQIIVILNIYKKKKHCYPIVLTISAHTSRNARSRAIPRRNAAKNARFKIRNTNQLRNRYARKILNVNLYKQAFFVLSFSNVIVRVIMCKLCESCIVLLGSSHSVRLRSKNVSLPVPKCHYEVSPKKRHQTFHNRQQFFNALATLNRGDDNAETAFHHG